MNDKDLDPFFDDFSVPFTALSMSDQPKRRMEMIIDARVIASATRPPQDLTSPSYKSVHGDPMSCDSLISFALFVQ